MSSPGPEATRTKDCKNAKFSPVNFLCKRQQDEYTFADANRISTEAAAGADPSEVGCTFKFKWDHRGALMAFLGGTRFCTALSKSHWQEFSETAQCIAWPQGLRLNILPAPHQTH